MSKNAKKLKIGLGVFVGFIFLLIIIASLTGGNSSAARLDKVKKASFAEQLRSKSLDPIKLKKAKVSDNMTQSLEKENKNNLGIQEKSQLENKPLNSEMKEKEFNSVPLNKNDPWAVALANTSNKNNNENENKNESAELNIDDNMQNLKNEPNKIQDQTLQEKDAQNFVKMVSNHNLIKDALVKIPPKQPESNEISFSTQSSLPSNQDALTNKFLKNAKLSTVETKMIKGLDQSVNRGQMFKAGTRVFAILPDTLTVNSGDKISTSLIAFGSTQFKFPDHVTFVGKAQLNTAQDRVEIIIEQCVNTVDDSPPLPCKAVTKDILGDNGLPGKIYDPSIWQYIVSGTTGFLGTYVLSKMTYTTSQNGTTIDSTSANQVAQALAGSITNLGNLINSQIAKAGTKVTLAAGAIVQVFFTDTTQTWNISSNKNSN